MTIKHLTILFAILFGIGSSSFGQTMILSKLNFEDGRWKFFGIAGKNKQNSLQDSIGNFYVNDIDVLKSIQKNWDLEEHIGAYACGYHYKFVFIQNDSIEHYWMLNLDCNEICGETLCYEFPEDKLRMFFSKLRKIQKAKYEVHDLLIARKLYKKMLSIDTILIESNNYKYWSNFSGVIELEIKENEFISNENPIELITKSIKSKYPNEYFLVEEGRSVYSEDNTISKSIFVYCSKSLGSNINIYRTIGSWKPFENISFTIYGLIDSEIPEFIKNIE
jgi:hypothetical protein